MVRLPEDLRVLQIPRERPIRYIVTNMVKGQEPPQPALKILECLLLQLRFIVINTGSVRVQVPTRQTGNSSTTTYKDKYGRIQKRGNSQRK